MYVWVAHVHRYLLRPEEGVGFPRLRATGYSVGAGNQAGSSVRAASVLNHQTSSLPFIFEYHMQGSLKTLFRTKLFSCFKLPKCPPFIGQAPVPA